MVGSNNELGYDETLKLISNFSQDSAKTTTLPTNQLNKYSIKDLSSLISRIHTVRDPSRQGYSATGAKSLVSYFQPINDYIGELIRSSDRFKELCPEIDESANILISCILAPNDLHEGNPTIKSKDIYSTGIPQTIADNINKYIQDYFNEYCKFGEKLRDWLYESMYRSGAKVILVLPEKILNSLVNGPTKAGSESGSAALKKFNKQSRNDTPILDIEKEWSELTKVTPLSPKSGLEHFKFDVKKDVSAPYLCDKFGLPQEAVPAMESVAVKFTSILNEGDILNISENPEILRFGKYQQKQNLNSINKRMLGHLIGEQEDIVSLFHHLNVNDKSVGHPLILELPTESVIPVCVPGSKKEKLGYFVLIDEFGNPLEAKKYLMTNTFDCSNQSAANAFSSIYGSSMSDKYMYAGSLNNKDGRFDVQKSVMANVFDYILDNMLVNKLKNMGLGNVDIGKFNDISACMLRRVLEKKRTSLVFVPTDFITYLAYDYREDGTGKSILENIKTILSIRTTLLVASMMSATNAAIPHRTIQISLDNKDQAWEQTIQQVFEMATLKANGGLSMVPTDIMSGVIDQHLSVVPKGIAGLEGMEIEKSETQNSSIRVDDVVLDGLNKMIVTNLQVPPAALNQVGEHDYARSVATTNIYFANKLVVKQNITETILSDHCRRISKFDPLFVNNIKNLLNSRPLDSSESVVNVSKTKSSETKDGTLDVTQNEQDEYSVISTIIDSIVLELPTPNIASNKAQLNEIQELMNLVDTYVDKIYNRDIFSMDEELSSMHAVLLSSLKATVYKEIVSKLGAVGSLTIPTIEEMIDHSDELEKTYNLVSNLKERFNQNKLLRSPPDESVDLGGTPDSTSGSSDSDAFSW